MGKNTVIVVRVEANTAVTDLASAADGGLDQIVAFLPAAENALQHHDRVIDQHPDAEGPTRRAT